MDRSTTVLNLSDIRPLKGLPTNAVRSTVTSLILVRCGLTELPPDIGGFKSLERLIVAFNSVRNRFRVAHQASDANSHGS